jgi:hypothetical protein
MPGQDKARTGGTPTKVTTTASCRRSFTLSQNALILTAKYSYRSVWKRAISLGKTTTIGESLITMRRSK